MLPAWFTTDIAKLQADSGLEAHQVLAQATGETYAAYLQKIFDAQALYVLSELRLAARQTQFPTADAVLVLLNAGETIEQLAARVEGQKAVAIQAAESLTLAKLWYALPVDAQDGRAKGHWMTAQALLGSLKRELCDTRKRFSRLSAPIV